MNALIIPGLNIDPSQIWIPYVTGELRGLDYEVDHLKLPAFGAQKRRVLPGIEKRLTGVEDPLIIAHSTGGTAALRYAEEHSISGLVLVSPYYRKIEGQKAEALGYFDAEWKWSQIKENVGWISLFASTDDTFGIPIAQAREINRYLDTDYHEYTNMGHFTDNTEFPKLIEVVERNLEAVL